METLEGFFSISVSSVLEDVLKEQGKRLSDMDLASRGAEEAETRRYEAGGWIRRTVGFAGATDLPEQPTEEEFRLGLRSGFILCTALNKVQPGAVPKVVVSSKDSVILPDGVALSAYQYFENIRNFLVAVEEIGLPTFEVSDFEEGGKSSRIINCILAIKSYSQWKKMGGTGSWKFGAIVKPSVSGKALIRKNSGPFSNFFSRSRSLTGRESSSAEQNLNAESHEMTSSLSMLVRAVLSDKQPEEVPVLVESILSKVVEEFERRIASQNELVKTTLKGLQEDGKSFSKMKVMAEPASTTCEMKKKVEETKLTMSKEENLLTTFQNEEASKEMLLKQYSILDEQQRHIQEIRSNLKTSRVGMEFMQIKYSEEIQHIGKHMCSLANAASGYHKVLEENRKLYNQVQDLKGSIRVYCRVRPFFTARVSSSTIGCIEEGNIKISTPLKYGKDGLRTFSFNKVFGPTASQEEVFADTQPLIRSVLDGYNVCIFAYGQTGSGKTYTMSGPQELNQHDMGVNYRALSDLFNLAEQRRGTFTHEISVQMIEIYNEQVRDLLISDGSNRRLDIRNGSQNGVNVPEANLFPVSSTADVIELMKIGKRNRAVGSTALNDRSSRSHSCLTIHVQGKDLTSGTTLLGCMHLVDLAGSERVDKSEVTGERLREAQHINKSLSALGDVISALAQKNSHVPYRNSKLTQLLQDSLGGQAKTLMFVHISPEIHAIGETISTLKFAERVSTVELGAARLNKESAEIKELKEQIASLKTALSRREGGLNNLQTTPVFGASKMKGGSPSPAFSNREYEEDIFSYQRSSLRQQMVEVSNVEIQTNSASEQQKTIFDLQELLLEDSHPWPDSIPVANSHQGDDKEFSSGNWVDKIVVNKHDGSLGDCGKDGTLQPDFFYQRNVSDSKVIQAQQYSRDLSQRKDHQEFEMNRNRFDPAIPDDSDDLDVATSDSFEADVLWQFNVPKATYTNNRDGSKIKKTRTKAVNSPDLRPPTHAQIPSPSRKPSPGTSRIISKLPSFIEKDAKRASVGGKLQGGK